MSNPDPNPVWAAFQASDLIAQQAESGHPWLPFLEVSTLSLGLYVLPAGAVDPQQPHERDEVYYVLSGRAVIQVEEEEREVGPGSVIYVRAFIDHRFVSIADDFQVLVFFSTAEVS